VKFHHVRLHGVVAAGSRACSYYETLLDSYLPLLKTSFEA